MGINEIRALLECFGDRYINVSDEQAQLDTKYSREKMVETFNAILCAVNMAINENANDGEIE